MKKYNIYEEGYRATGEYGPARLIGSAEGETFLDACNNHVADNPELEKLYQVKDGVASHWACKWFDNLSDAQEFVG